MAHPGDVELDAEERLVARLVGVEADTVNDVLEAIRRGTRRTLDDAKEAVLFGLVAAAAWRQATAGGVGALSVEERDAFEPIRHGERSPIGDVLVSQGLRPVAYLPDIAAMMTLSLGVAGQAVGIEEVRRAM